nr:helix-turn-helix domain-containing protein [Pseudomonas luteola]
MTVQTVFRWCLRFSQWGLDGLNDEPRSGQPRSISDEKVQEVVDRARQTKPEDASH